MSLNIRVSNVLFSALIQAAIVFISVVGVFTQSPEPDEGVWSAETSLANQGGYVGVAGSGTVVHAVYSLNEPSTIINQPPIHSTDPIMYRRSTNEGESFATATRIGRGPLGTAEGAVGALFLEDTVMADGNLVAVCYYNNFQAIDDFASGTRNVGDIFIVVSTNGGADFLTRTPIKLNTGETGFALRHSISIDGQNIHVVWMDFRNGKWDIYYQRSTDSGVTWLTEDKLLVTGMIGETDSQSQDSGVQRPQIAANGDTIHVAWMDGRDGNDECFIEGGTRLPQCTEIYYTKSINNGTSFLSGSYSIIRLTTSTSTPPTYSGRPDIVTDGSSTVYVLYDKRLVTGTVPSNNEIFNRKSTNNGVNFGDPVQLTNNVGVSTHSSGIAFDTGGLFVIWINDSDGGGNYQVYSQYGDNANTQQQVSSIGNAGAPILGASNSYVHAIWSSGTGISLAIRYSRRPF